LCFFSCAKNKVGIVIKIMTTERISFSLLQAVYETYRTDGHPCKNPSIHNQCAVRMSLALGRNGFSFENFHDQPRIHHGRTDCQLGDEPHLVGADELHRFIMQMWDAGQRDSGSEIRSRIAGLPGIIYFNNCFARTEGGARTGDHIDLWNGSQIYNQVLGISAGGSVAAGTDLFSRASFVRFFWLPS
jgi:Type VI secretion system (T6SS), amidase effector protein 4